MALGLHKRARSIPYLGQGCNCSLRPRIVLRLCGLLDLDQGRPQINRTHRRGTSGDAVG
jgi:hypothetical protein